MAQEKTTVIHFAPSEKALKQRNSMCGFVPDEDQLSTDPAAVNCQDCADWITAPREATT
jgi:hypothetical protein